jgi:hypothetical protein
MRGPTRSSSSKSTTTNPKEINKNLRNRAFTVFVGGKQNISGGGQIQEAK